MIGLRLHIIKFPGIPRIDGEWLGILNYVVFEFLLAPKTLGWIIFFWNKCKSTYFSRSVVALVPCKVVIASHGDESHWPSNLTASVRVVIQYALEQADLSCYVREWDIRIEHTRPSVREIYTISYHVPI